MSFQQRTNTSPHDLMIVNQQHAQDPTNHVCMVARLSIQRRCATKVPVPIVVGGTSPRALRRAAHLGDAWQAVGRTPDEFGADLRRRGEGSVMTHPALSSLDREPVNIRPSYHACRALARRCCGGWLCSA